MRKVRKGKADSRVMAIIAKNYNRLKLLCGYRNYGLFCSKSYEDLFQDTVLFISQDEKALTLLSEQELIDYFCYRFRMIEFQTVNDNKLLKEIPYADYLQATKAASTEG